MNASQFCRRCIACLCVLATLLVANDAVRAAGVPLGSAFTYQGKLENGGSPFNGSADFEFRLFDSAAGGALIGAPIALGGVSVSSGVFTATLNFGVLPFAGEDRYLEIRVRAPSGGGAYTTLTPRQRLTASPYAMYALTAGNSSPFVLNGSSAVYSGGNVGIGTSSPAANLHIFGSQATVRLEHNAGDSFTEIKDATTQQLRINKTNNAGGVLLDLNPKPTDGASDAQVRFFRETDTAGPKHVQFLRGDFSTSESARIAVDGADSFFQMHGGSVGIGTSTPTAKLDVDGAIRSSGAAGGVVLAMNPNNAGASLSMGWLNDVARLRYGGNGAGAGGGFDFQRSGDLSLMRILHNGDVGIGTTSPGARLAVQRADSGTVMRIDGSGTGGTGIIVANSNIGLSMSTPGGTGTAISIPSVLGNARAASFYGITSSPLLSVWNDGSGEAALFNGRVVINGMATVDVLQIMGADLAEKFPTSESGTLEPGTVMELDPENAGALRVARGEYNRRVAGVVSGANDLPAGAILGNLPGNEDAPPIALSGRVWVKCDAQSHPIEIGDLLTTSNTPGHAMSANDSSRSAGAVLGKAMTALERGERGMVLVLVSLQ